MSAPLIVGSSPCLCSGVAYHSVYVDQVKEDEMGREFSTNGEEECIYNIGVKVRREETTRQTKT
jgi:hypothetical protein